MANAPPDTLPAESWIISNYRRGPRFTQSGVAYAGWTGMLGLIGYTHDTEQKKMPANDARTRCPSKGFTLDETIIAQTEGIGLPR